MTKQITRREILKFAGGSALGLLFTPLPWKLLDDSAIWTQNWSLTPKLPRGPIATKFSVCTLCNGGCAVRAKCVSDIPFYLSGVTNHPLTHGTLCPRGIGGHHLAYHPLRILHPHKFAVKSSDSKLTALKYETAINEIASIIKRTNGSVAILDQQPGRAISEIYKEFLDKLSNGIFLSSPSQEETTLIALQNMMPKEKSGQLGYDLENTKLVLSFGAPLLDSWGTPGRMTEIFNKREENGLQLVQIESRQSRTAMQADKWIPINPNSERHFALSIAAVMVSENLYSKTSIQHVTDFSVFKKLVKAYTPENVACITGVSPDITKNIARQLATTKSTIVLSSADAGAGPFEEETEKAIAVLNVLIGNIGKLGGIIHRKEIPGYKKIESKQWNQIPDNSISVLIIDSADSGFALPWQLVERKLIRDNNTIITLSPYLSETSAHADYIIPSPAHFEMAQDVVTSSGNNVSTFALSSPLLKKKEGTTEPNEFLKSLTKKIDLSFEIPTNEEMIKQKIEAIYSSKRGTVHTFSEGTSVNVADLSSSDDLWTKFNEGAVWVDEPAKQTTSMQFTFAVKPEFHAIDNDLKLIPYGWRGSVSAALMSPVMSKLFQEMELREMNGTVLLNPETAVQLGINEIEPTILKTEKGMMNVTVKISSAVRPGIIEAPVGPLPNGIQTPLHPEGNNILNLCQVNNDGTWRTTKAILVKA